MLLFLFVIVDITEILLKVELNTIKQKAKNKIFNISYACIDVRHN
jgi:hypothetical protein